MEKESNKNQTIKTPLTMFPSFFRKFVWLGFLLLIFLTAFLIPSFYIENQKIAISDILFPFIFVFWLIGIVFRQYKFRWHQFYWLLAFYLAAMIASTIFSADFNQSLIKLAGETYLISLAVLTFNLVRTKKDVKQAIFVWLIGTAVTIAVGIITI